MSELAIKGGPRTVPEDDHRDVRFPTNGVDTLQSTDQEPAVADDCDDLAVGETKFSGNRRRDGNPMV